MAIQSFLKECDFTPQQWLDYVNLAEQLKSEHYSGKEIQRLQGKSIALIFEKTSTRTRASFEIAAFQQGAHTTYLDTSVSQIGHKESLADTARVLSRMYDAIEFRGNKQSDLEQLARYAHVPVFNGLTDEWHPTQMLADALTIREHTHKDFTEVVHVYMGDARFNTGRSLLVSSAMLGMDVRIVAPKQYQPDDEAIRLAHDYAQETGARITITDDIAQGIKNADVISTDIWVSMGEPQQAWEERIKALLPYQVNEHIMNSTGKDTFFMHCLPAFHNTETTVGQEIYEKYNIPELEVTNDVFESSNSIVFDQAENRMHTIKSVMVTSLAS
ncbi:MAG: ornithine carbamoyltransferase [Actinomycetaceae bacterium]|nr:ornithine carbamoyltransferase [Actinomycetaceae bacterium]